MTQNHRKDFVSLFLQPVNIVKTKIVESNIDIILFISTAPFRIIWWLLYQIIRFFLQHILKIHSLPFSLYISPIYYDDKTNG